MGILKAAIINFTARLQRISDHSPEVLVHSGKLDAGTDENCLITGVLT
jgi:hypothetical protein